MIVAARVLAFLVYQILLSDSCECKITDFGLARELAAADLDSAAGSDGKSFEQAYIAGAGYKASNPTAYRWTSLEGLIHQTYTIQSDVWSFGVVLFEICSRGTVPYPQFQDLTAEFVGFLEAGGRIHVQDTWLPIMRQTMPLCWSTYPAQRPTFGGLVNCFEAVLKASFGSRATGAVAGAAQRSAERLPGGDAAAAAAATATATNSAANVHRAYSVFDPAGCAAPAGEAVHLGRAPPARVDDGGGAYISRRQSVESGANRASYAVPAGQRGFSDGPEADVVFLNTARPASRSNAPRPAAVRSVPDAEVPPAAAGYSSFGGGGGGGRSTPAAGGYSSFGAVRSAPVVAEGQGYVSRRQSAESGSSQQHAYAVPLGQSTAADNSFADVVFLPPRVLASATKPPAGYSRFIQGSTAASQEGASAAAGRGRAAQPVPSSTDGATPRAYSQFARVGQAGTATGIPGGGQGEAGSGAGAYSRFAPRVGQGGGQGGGEHGQFASKHVAGQGTGPLGVAPGEDGVQPSTALSTPRKDSYSKMKGKAGS